MLKRSRCGPVRICRGLREPSTEIVRVEARRAIFPDRGKPSAEIVRVEALLLRRRANLSWSPRTLCGYRACGSALAAAPCEFVAVSASPLRRSCVLNRSRCGSVWEPHDGFSLFENRRPKSLSVFRLQATHRLLRSHHRLSSVLLCWRPCCLGAA